MGGSERSEHPGAVDDKFRRCACPPPNPLPPAGRGTTAFQPNRPSNHQDDLAEMLPSIHPRMCPRCFGKWEALVHG